MNILDILMLIGILGSLGYSLYRGLINEIFALLSLIIGTVAATRFYMVLSKYVAYLILNQLISRVLSYLIIFIVVLVVIRFAGKLLKLTIKKLDLIWVDRIGGALCGVIKALVIISIITFFLIYALPPTNKTLRTSRLIPYMDKLNSIILRLTPPKIKERYSQKLLELKNFW